MSMTRPLPPPEGFTNWLDFAVETFDTRGPWVNGLFSEDAAPDRDAMREAARAELSQLRQIKEDARLALGCTFGPPKGVYRFKSHEEQNRQEDRWLAEGMAKLALERRRVANAAPASSLSNYEPANALVSEEAIAVFLAGAETSRDPSFIANAQGIAERARAKLKT